MGEQRDEYKVHMEHVTTKRKSFTLVNATSEPQARMRAARFHGKDKRIVSAEKTGRQF